MTPSPAIQDPAQALTLDRSTSSSSVKSVQYLQRLEGLTVSAVSALLYFRTGASWWLFAALWLAPDLSMLGYLSTPCRGARIYNAFHTYTLPVTLAFCGLALHAYGVLPYALIWINHISLDRWMGYGLKYADGFGYTHLGWRGKQAAK